MSRTLLRILLMTFFALVLSAADAAEKKKLVLIAGTASHGPGEHEFNAGCKLLKKCLENVPELEVVTVLNGWPKDESILQGADAVFIYSDGGDGHLAIKPERLATLQGLVDKGVGIGCAHYAVEVPANKGGAKWLEWMGGYFETYWSVNPHWTANFKELPTHPITRGVKPFEIRDEWYYHMRFRPEMKGVTPILTAVPPDSTRGKAGAKEPHGGNPDVFARKGQAEHVMWASESPSGARGFGFTGGHFHNNWGNDNFRKVVLNALLWIAKVEVPAQGVESKVTPEELKANLDPKGGPRADAGVSSGRSGNRNSNRGTGPEAARQDLGTMQVAEGLAATLFASEPMFVNPTDIDVDSRGRVWVTEGANYRRWNNPPLRPEGDRIVILQDNDYDGDADEAKIFYQDPTINSALGICVLGNRVIVASSPHVFVLTDTDGDDKADRREILFTGISGNQHDHGVHAFVFGPDGKLYFNFGNEGRQLQYPVDFANCPLNGPIPEIKTKPVVDLAGHEINHRGKPYRQGMVFRCNPDGTAVETLGWNFRNNYEVCVDSFGNLWQSDNDDDGNRGVRINFVMEYGNYGFTDELTGAGWGSAWNAAKAKGAPESEKPFYHWHQYDPGVVPNLLQTGAGSPTGIAFYEGTLLPAVFRNQVIHCDAGPNVARAYPVEKSGAGFSATITNLLTSKDSWYRPADICTGPDGSVYIADWNDPGVGGHAMGDNQLATMRGRIYRLAPPGQRPGKPVLDLTTTEGRIAALQSPNLATRYLGWTELHKAGAEAEPALLKLWQGNDPIMKARAVQLLARLPGKAKQYIDSALADRDADLRIVGLRMARALNQDVIGAVTKLVNDPSAQLRRECAIALRDSKVSQAPALWAALARQHDGKDRWYLEALGIGAAGQDDRFFVAWLQAVGDQWNTPAGRDIIWRSRSTRAPDYLVKIVNDPATKDRQRYVRSLDFIEGPEKKAALLELITSGIN